MVKDGLTSALQRVWASVEAARIPAANVSGLAMSVWKHPRSTLDIDLLVVRSADSLRRLISTLHANGVRQLGQAPVELGTAQLWPFELQLSDSVMDIRVDVLVARSEFAVQAVERAMVVTKETLGFEFRVITCEDLIILKLISGRFSILRTPLLYSMPIRCRSMCLA